MDVNKELRWFWTVRLLGIVAAITGALGLLAAVVALVVVGRLALALWLVGALFVAGSGFWLLVRSESLLSDLVVKRQAYHEEHIRQTVTGLRHGGVESVDRT